MDPQHARNDPIIAELLSMGFDISAAAEAVRTESVATLADAVEFLLAGGQTNTENRHQDLSLPLLATAENEGIAPKTEMALEANSQDLVGNPSSYSNKQEYKCLSQNSKDCKKITDSKTRNVGGFMASSNSCRPASLELIKGDKGSTSSVWEKQPDDLCTKAEEALRKHFGYSGLKPFQLEALKAWEAHQDCLVIAATGSGKSLCFQLPALLTGKVVIVISPLISLMHDQCLQLSRCNITACFLGSGQVDKSVEKKAMAGMYSIVYVCPETLPRLINSLKELACKRGIALFAIDEAHCISKWGHDFRPHYRRLSVLRETFQIQSLPGLKDHIPILALTATATNCVEVDILNSLKINSSMARIVRTTLFRPNLRFSVCHSKTCKPSSYEKDFKSLIEYYAHGSGSKSQNNHCSSGDTKVNGISIKGDHKLPYWGHNKQSGTYGKNEQVDRHLEIEEMDGEHGYPNEGDADEDADEDEDDAYPGGSNTCAQRIGNTIPSNKEQQELTVNFLEDDEEDEVERLGGDFEVAWNESLIDDLDGKYESIPSKSPSSEVERGPSIVYMPTRKETEALAKFLTQSGVKAAPYHAKLSKGYLREVHEQFRLGTLQVVVATIAFGMGIDKSNVRHIIHYGWPQSLEAYYQEAGRAGRDGLSSECLLYCDMTVLPSLLPSRRDPEQTQHALRMLDQCFRYGLSTSKCRANTLLMYFGEDLANGRCEICDVCSFGPPPLENLTKEAEILLTMLSRSKALSSTSNQRKRQADGNGNQRTFLDAVEEIDKHNDITPRQCLWWRGFGRVLIDAGFLKETSRAGRSPRKLVVPHLRNPRVTAEGQKFLDEALSGKMTNFSIHPQGDMIQAMLEPKFDRQGGMREWGRGWADPEIRKQRLSRSRFSRRKPREKRQRRGSFKQRQGFW